MRWALKGSIFEDGGENCVETDELSIAIVANGDKMGLRESCRSLGTRRSSGLLGSLHRGNQLPYLALRTRGFRPAVPSELRAESYTCPSNGPSH